MKGKDGGGKKSATADRGKDGVGENNPLSHGNLTEDDALKLAKKFFRLKLGKPDRTTIEALARLKTWEKFKSFVESDVEKFFAEE